MKRLSNVTLVIIAAVSVGLTIILSGYCSAETKADTRSVSKSVRKPKYSLRSNPIKVSQAEFQNVFELGESCRPLKYIQNEFEDNRDGTITDYATSLSWQKSGSPNCRYLKDVPAYIERLNSEKFAGYSDWRLPTVDELKSLITENKQSNGLYINPMFDKTQWWCWTSDRRPSSGAWFVYFHLGHVGWGSIYDNHGVRAVRSRQ